MVKKAMIAKSIGTFKQIDRSHIVVIQLNIFIPIGTAMVIVAAVKLALVSTS
jgi:hypothetical protein